MNSRPPALGVWPEITTRSPPGRNAAPWATTAGRPTRRVSPAPVGSRTSSCPPSTCWAASTHFPSGDSARPRPSPRRTGGAPSVRRRNRPYSSRWFCSSKSTKRPSSDSAVGKDQSSHERSRSRASPGAAAHDLPLRRGAADEHAALRRDVVQHHEPEHAEESARPAGEVGRGETRPGGEEEVVPRRGPGQAVRGPGEHGSHVAGVSVGGDDLDRGLVVAPARVVEERHAPAVPRDARVRDPAARLEEDAAHRVLEPPQRPRVAHHRKALSVRGPVGLLDALEDLPRGAAAERHARERPGALPPDREPPAEGEHELAGRRDGEDVGARHAHRAGLAGVEPHGEDVDRLALPRRPVDDGLAVGGEAGGEHGAAPERQGRDAHVGRRAVGRAAGGEVAESGARREEEAADRRGRPAAETTSGWGRGTGLGGGCLEQDARLADVAQPALAGPSRGSASAAGAPRAASRRAGRRGRARGSRRRRARRSPSRRRRAPCPSASRRGPPRRPRCRRGGPRPCRGPARATCRRPSRG